MAILHSVDTGFRKSWEILLFRLMPHSILHDLLIILPCSTKASPRQKFTLHSLHKYHPSISSSDHITMMKDPCSALTSEGIEYREFSCLYPALDRFYFRYVHFIPPSCSAVVSGLLCRQPLRSANCHCRPSNLGPFCLKTKIATQNIEPERRRGLEYFENSLNRMELKIRQRDSTMIIY
jgi:hypothetical protein